MAYRKVSIKYKSGKKRAKPVKSKLPITISNPFNSKVLNPKINDGVVPYSSGVRCQYASEYPCFGEASPMIMYLFPSLTTGLAVFRSQLPSYGSLGVYPNHIYLGQDVTDPTNPGPVIQSDATEITHWRTVSQALKLTLINNCEANDGWFEAIRIDTPESIVGWTQVPNGDPDVDLFQQVVVCPQQVRDEITALPPTPPDPNIAYNSGNQNVFLPGHNSRQMGSYATHPTYVTGKLKDLHKYVFQLRPNKREHEMIQLRPTGASLTSLVNDGLIDNSFDSIVIKIYGRSYPTGTAAADAVNTRIHAHLIANQELVFDETTPLSRYHTNCRYNEAEVLGAKRSNVQNVKAAYISKVK